MKKLKNAQKNNYKFNAPVDNDLVGDFLIAISVATLVALIGVTVAANVRSKKYGGVIDNVKVEYLQRGGWGFGRNLTIEEQDGTRIFMFDKNEDNILGNHPNELIEITLPNGIKIEYGLNKVIVNSLENQKTFHGKLTRSIDEKVSTLFGEETIHLNPTSRVFSKYTKIFKKYVNKIYSK